MRAKQTTSILLTIIAAIQLAGCNTEAKKQTAQRAQEVDSMAELRARGGTDLSNPEMGSKVLVRLSEYKITLSHTEIPKGQVTFAVENKGKEPHEFEITGPAGTWRSGRLPTGSTILMSMILDKGGEYQLYSPTKTDAGTDRERGMDAKLLVKYQ
ncbi:MAG TPA: cupredoxin domain-containing protein [Longimicrobiales bacterium]|nr:cupredoxin domain-containing protein [Longimicrobiales bacterium]